MNFKKTDLRDIALLEWVKKNPRPWQNELILNWEDILSDKELPNRSPFTLSAKTSYGPVNLSNVVGQRDHYAGQSWIDALTEPQYKEGRMKNTIHLFDTEPEYYFSEEEKDIYFDSIDGKEWYSNGGGNHRTVVAKFGTAMVNDLLGIDSVIKNVHRTCYEVDWNLLSIYRNFKDICKRFSLDIDVQVTRHEISSSSVGGAGEEFYEPVFFVTDRRFSNDMNDDLFGHLDRFQFSQYAAWITETSGNIMFAERWRYWVRFWIGNDHNTLIFPGYRSERREDENMLLSRLRQLRGA